jgi:diguanylate cyclase (GGDEF)-like protein
LTDVEFSAFVGELQELTTAAMLRVNAVELLCFDGSNWIAGSGKIVRAVRLLEMLDATLSARQLKRSGKRILVPVEDVNAIVILSLHREAHDADFESARELVKACVRHAVDGYAAYHDVLTTLPNRRGFERDVLSRLAAAPQIGSAPNSGAPFSLFLLSIDLDKFKDINDDRGHPYGDLVLFALARLLREFAATYNRAAEDPRGVLSVDVARFGGEEFVLALTGHIGPPEARIVAEALRKEVQVSGLPRDEDARQYSKSVPLPPAAERTVRTSLGFSGSAVAELVSDYTVAINSLGRQADTALYVAKQAGRNCVREFENILLSGGRVLKHHLDAGVVVIDIGSDVGVRGGHRFDVFHPSFVGDVAYKQSDGRGEPTLGTYPRRRMASIEVFEADARISFCTVYQHDGLAAIPEHSALLLITRVTDENAERIVVDERRRGSNRLTELIRTLADSDRSNDFAVGIVCISNVAALSETGGRVLVEQTMDLLISLVRAEFSDALRYSAVHGNEVRFVVVGINASAVQEHVQGLFQRLHAERSRGVFKVGLYINGYFESSRLAEDKSTISPRSALEFARFALSAAPETGNQMVAFSDATPWRLLHESLREGRAALGLEQYRAMRTLGIENALLEREASLCALQIASESAKAIEAARRAVELARANPLYWINLCYVLAMLGEFDEAATIPAEAVPLALDEAVAEYNGGYRAALALAMRFGMNTDNPSVRDNVHTALRDALDARWDPQEDRLRVRVEEALAAMSS